MKFQQEAYQDMLHHMQYKFHTVESQSIWLTTHLIRNSEIIIKTNCQNAGLAFRRLVKAACAQSGRLLP